MLYNENKEHCPPRPREQAHVHEIQGSVAVVLIEEEEKKDSYYDECKKDPHKHCPEIEGHNHRFATVSGEAMPLGPDDHFHEVRFRTDFYEDHFHVFIGRTLGAIPVGDRHVHFLESQTRISDGHRHDFRFATLIDDPIGE